MPKFTAITLTTQLMFRELSKPCKCPKFLGSASDWNDWNGAQRWNIWNGNPSVIHDHASFLHACRLSAHA